MHKTLGRRKFRLWSNRWNPHWSWPKSGAYNKARWFIKIMPLQIS